MRSEGATKEIYWGDAPHRPDLQGRILEGKRGKILVTIYRTGGAGIHPTVLLSHGIPGIEKNLDLAQALRRVGFHVVTYHYSGSWNSEGDYSFAHNLEDSRTVLDFIEQDTELGFDRNRIYAVGHSMGCFVTAHLFAQRKNLRAAVFLAPCDLGEVVTLPEETEGKRLLREIFQSSAPWLSRTSGDALYQEAAQHSESYRIRSVAEALADRPTYCIGAAWDESCPPNVHCLPWVEAVHQAGGNILYEEMRTDHSFSDMRLALIEKTVAYLTELEK